MGNTGTIKDLTTRIYYTVDTYWWYDPGYHQSPYWRPDCSGPGGNTKQEAYKQVKEILKRYSKNKVDLSKVKIKITKTIKTESTDEELVDSDFTALMLKTA